MWLLMGSTLLLKNIDIKELSLIDAIIYIESLS